LAKKSSLFDDPSVEISQLSYKITQDITAIKERLTLLKQARSEYAINDSSRQHSTTVVGSLDRSIAKVAQNLKNVLEVRTHNVEAQQQKKQQFTGTSSASKRNRRPKANALYYKSMGGMSNFQENGSHNGEMASLPMPNEGGTQSQLLQYEHSQANIEAVERIEQTLIELTDIFKEMSQLVVQQGEDIQRIDQNIDDTLLNLETAQGELMKRLRSLTSSRSLIFKLFLVLIVFIIIFFLFFI